MPKKEETHIQKIAPGPPKAIAVPTPTILPVPTVAARAVEKPCSWVMPLFSELDLFFFEKREANVVLKSLIK